MNFIELKQWANQAVSELPSCLPMSHNVFKKNECVRILPSMKHLKSPDRRQINRTTADQSSWKILSDLTTITTLLRMIPAFIFSTAGSNCKRGESNTNLPVNSL